MLPGEAGIGPMAASGGPMVSGRTRIRGAALGPPLSVDDPFGPLECLLAHRKMGSLHTIQDPTEV